MADAKEQHRIRVGVLGLGPVGLIMAVNLQEAGCDVVLCGNDKMKLNLIRREGVKLENVLEKKAKFEHICGSIAELKDHELDYLVISLKTYHIPSIIDKLAEIKTDKLNVICAQNGIDSEKALYEAFAESQVLRMVVNFAGNLNAANNVKVTFFNPPNYIASVDDSRIENAKEFADLLNSVDIHTKGIDSFEMLRRVWEKTILNACISAMCGIGKFTIKEAMDFPDTLEVVEQTIEEAVEVAEAEKIMFEDDFIRKCLRYLKKAGNHFPSMAVDLINNRPTEIDHINGKIVTYGKKHYIRTSLNLTFTNMVKAMSQKHLSARLNANGTGMSTRSIADNKLRIEKELAPKGKVCYLGVDLGSAYTKFVVINEQEEFVFQSTLRTVNRDKVALKHVMKGLYDEFPIEYSCATGYGRKNFPDADMIKTEINCCAAGVSKYFPGEKNIIDIGGEDIKAIQCNERNEVEKFYLNDKCAAGTGSFLTEIAERAEINIPDMSDLAAKSHFNHELNSFCTVFAKTEIMKWMFDGVPIEDMSKGLYLAIANRVAKLRTDPDSDTYMVGGVIEHHPFLAKLLGEKMKKKVEITERPQHMVAFGAARIAKNYYELNKDNITDKGLISV